MKSVNSCIFLIALTCSFSCQTKSDKNPVPAALKSKRFLNVENVIKKSDRFYNELVSNTSFSYEDVARLKTVEEEMILQKENFIRTNASGANHINFKKLHKFRKNRILEIIDTLQSIEYNNFESDFRLRLSQIK